MADGIIRVFVRVEHQPVVNNTDAWGEEDLNEVGACGTLHRARQDQLDH